jgi:hypothetical protein
VALASEIRVSQFLRAALASIADGEVLADDDLTTQLSGFEHFLPKLLREVHAEWEDESLDGFLPVIARKAGPLEAEIIGHCILISDQTIVPFHLLAQIDVRVDEICWMELRLGKTENGKMVRTPYGGNWPSKHFWLSQSDLDSMDWSYAITFGAKQRDSTTL